MKTQPSRGQHSQKNKTVPNNPGSKKEGVRMETKKPEPVNAFQAKLMELKKKFKE